MITKIWDWLNGNKTTIGFALLTAAGHIPEETVVFDIPVASVLYWVGGLLTGGGLTHKVKKKFSPSKLPS